LFGCFPYKTISNRSVLIVKSILGEYPQKPLPYGREAIDNPHGHRLGRGEPHALLKPPPNLLNRPLGRRRRFGDQDFAEADRLLRSIAVFSDNARFLLL
jgi:hypothetical protein